jgi:hypothetical protein
MKIYKSNYRNHWLSPYTILEKVFFWKEIDFDDPFIEKWADRLMPFCQVWQKVFDFIRPQINYVKINHYDTWSMDHTLADIILPMLKQLKATKHGSPAVDDEDVPFELRSYCAWPVESWETDTNWHKRWEYVLDEMIWAFEQKVNGDDESPYFDHGENWDTKPWDKDYEPPKIDWAGLKAHQERRANGFRLFGKYYEGLWD